MPGMGGGGGTISTTSAQQGASSGTSNQGPWGPQGPMILSALQGAQGLFNQQGQFSPWAGQTGFASPVAPWNPQQSAAFQSIVNNAQTSPLYGAGQNNWLNTIGGQYLNPSTNPWLQSTFNAAALPVAQQFQNITAPTTDAMFAAAGPLSGGGRQNAQQMNMSTLGQTLNNLATNIFGGNYQSERTNQMNALNMLPQMQSASYLDPSMMFGAGGAQQAQTQAELGGQMGQYYQGLQYPWTKFQLGMPILGQPYGSQGGYQGNTTMTGQQQSPYFTNPLATGLGGILGLGSLATPGIGGTSAGGNILGGIGSLLGLGGGAAGAAMPFSQFADAGLLLGLSDVRVKDDILPVGKTHDGQNLYSFRYKGDLTPRIGLMAQEVEQIMPEAVLTGLGGLKHVNYGLALLPSILMGSRHG